MCRVTRIGRYVGGLQIGAIDHHSLSLTGQTNLISGKLQRTGTTCTVSLSNCGPSVRLINNKHKDLNKCSYAC